MINIDGIEYVLIERNKNVSILKDKFSGLYLLYVDNEFIKSSRYYKILKEEMNKLLGV